MSIILIVGRGAELTAAGVFTFAGTAKLADLESTRLALGRVLFGEHRPARAIVTTVAVAVGLVDIAVGSSLLLVPSRAVAAAAMLITVGFIVAVTSAQRRGIACGCFGSLFTGTTGPAEVRRAAAMCVLAATGTAVRLVEPDGHANVASVIFSAAVWLSVLVAVSRHRPTRARDALRLALSGRAPDRGGWRRTTPWARAAIVRAVRADAATAEVTAHPSVGHPSWRAARVRTHRLGTVTIASIVARAPGGTVQALWRVGAPIAVVGYTRQGAVLPASSRFGLDGRPSA